jgi:hypothetical protein
MTVDIDLNITPHCGMSNLMFSKDKMLWGQMYT